MEELPPPVAEVDAEVAGPLTLVAEEPPPAAARAPPPTLPAGSAAQLQFICDQCGHVHVGPAPPERCPPCGAPASAFSETSDANIAGIFAGIAGAFLVTCVDQTR